MKTNKLNATSRIALLIGGLLLLVVLYVPLWSISLDAPQYPEGLSLSIYANKLAGDVEIINGLNHYIGMKTLHSADFPEFVILPYCIVFFSLFFILTAALANKKMLYILFGLFVAFGVIAMADFWKWEYDYGHNLNPNAAIQVPGMSYQPPLIGFKQLLNFGAYSMPDIGGFIFIIAGLILFTLVVIEIRRHRTAIQSSKMVKNTSLFLTFVLLSSCSIGQQPIQLGKDNCHHCKMTITDNRYGAEIVTQKGKVFVFDDLVCLTEFVKTKQIQQSNIKDYYVTDFSGSHALVNVKKAFFVKSDLISGPMNGKVAGFSTIEGAKALANEKAGVLQKWEEIF
jgi:copper chaperone NosL